MQHSHNADSSILGFLFQIERALMLLSSMPSDAIVGLEVDDDIVVKLQEDVDLKSIFEQAKFSRVNKSPFGNKSESLWKTLCIWIEGIESKVFDLENSNFSLVTNVRVTGNRIVTKLREDNKSDELVIYVVNELRKTARQLPQSMAGFSERVLNFPIDKLSTLVRKITLIDGIGIGDTRSMKNTLRNNLSLSKDLPIDYIYRSLYGFVADYLTDKWKKGDPGWLKVEAFNEQVTSLIATYKKKSFFEKTIESLPVGDKDIDNNKGKIYVKQLKKIECDEDEIIEAIQNFVRAESERIRLAEEGILSKDKIQLYYSDLETKWKAVSRPKFRFASDGEKVKTGYEVYYSCLEYKGRINDFVPEQVYTHSGTYHYLSDQKRIGWHPDWSQIE